MQPQASVYPRSPRLWSMNPTGASQLPSGGGETPGMMGFGEQQEHSEERRVTWGSQKVVSPGKKAGIMVMRSQHGQRFGEQKSGLLLTSGVTVGKKLNLSMLVLLQAWGKLGPEELRQGGCW